MGAGLSQVIEELKNAPSVIVLGAILVLLSSLLTLANSFSLISAFYKRTVGSKRNHLAKIARLGAGVNITCLKTAWFLGRHVREAMTVLHIDGGGELGGQGAFDEADETFIGGKEGNKHKSKRTGRGGGQGKAPVLALVERDGRVRSFHPADVTAATLRSVIVKHVDFASHFRTDEAHHYRHIGGLFASHETVAHSQDEYVRGDAHTNTAENFFSILKRGIYGCYFHVSEAHLHRYLAEFDFRHNNRAALGVDDLDRATRALVGAKGKRLTYRTTRGREA